MARPRIAIDAAVLAAAIRVDRAVEADIRRIVAGDDRARRVDAQGLTPRRRPRSAVPAPNRHRTRPAAPSRSGPVSLLAAPRPLRGFMVPGISMGRIMARQMRTNQEQIASPWSSRRLNAAARIAGDAGRARRAAQSARSSSPMAAPPTIPSTIARAAGARVVAAPRGRGTQLAAGAAARCGDLAAVPACRLPPGGRAGSAAVEAFIGRARRGRPGRLFRLCAGRSRPAARRLERIVAWRCRMLRAALWRPGAADRPQRCTTRSAGSPRCR